MNVCWNSLKKRQKKNIDSHRLFIINKMSFPELLRFARFNVRMNEKLVKTSQDVLVLRPLAWILLLHPKKKII